MKTSYPTPAEPAWFIVDAKEATVGRLSARIAFILKGKHKPTYVPHRPCGDHVIVINAKDAKLTGAKAQKKTYYRHTGYFGGLKETTAERLFDEQPEDIIRHAVKGMLPKNAMRDHLLKNLHVYPEAKHAHDPQKPQPLPMK